MQIHDSKIIDKNHINIMALLIKAVRKFYYLKKSWKNRNIVEDGNEKVGLNLNSSCKNQNDKKNLNWNSSYNERNQKRKVRFCKTQIKKKNKSKGKRKYCSGMVKLQLPAGRAYTKRIINEQSPRVQRRNAIFETDNGDLKDWLECHLREKYFLDFFME